MTDPTPTNPTPPQGLTNEQLRDVLWKCLCERKANESPFGAGSSSESDMQARMDDCRAAIAADRANRPAPSVGELVDVATDLHRVASDLSDKDLADSAHTCRQAATLLEQFRLGGWIVPTVEQVTPDHEANHFRGVTEMVLTPEEVEARFLAWWAESYPLAPAGGHAVRSHVAFALHLMGGEVAA